MILSYDEVENLKEHSKYFFYTTCEKCGKPFHTRKYRNNPHLCGVCKRQETCLKKYGGIGPLSSKEAKEKYKQTSLKNFGVHNPRKNKTISNKVEKTNILKYGGKSR